MKKIYFLTNQSNNYPHYNYITTKEEISSLIVSENDENIIYDEDSSFELVFCLIEKLKNATLFTDGRNIKFLSSLKNIPIYVNYDIYKYTLKKDIKDILPYKWSFRITPLTLPYVLGAYDDFIRYEKYAYFKLDDFHLSNWTEEELSSFKEVLSSLYEKYISLFYETEKSYMPYLLRETLKRLLGYATQQLLNTSSLKKCSSCLYKDYCSFNTSIYEYSNMCSIANILNECAYNVFSRLKEESSFQRTIFSIYKEIINA